MLQLFFAVAFSAVPLTLYVPPIRSLNLFVETLEELLRQTALHTLRAYPRVRLACSRIFNSVARLARWVLDPVVMAFPLSMIFSVFGLCLWCRVLVHCTDFYFAFDRHAYLG